MTTTTKTSYVKKIATIEDKASGEFFVKLSFLTETGAKRFAEIPRSEASDMKLLERRLLSLGALLPPIRNRKKFLEAVCDKSAKKQQRRAARSGWGKNNRHFVLQTDIVGSKSSSLIGIRPPIDREDRGWFKTAGTSLSWTKTVAAIAAESAPAMACISSAFAAPLLEPLKQDSFAICLSGKSRTGKTLITLLGASVVGLGEKERLLSWNLTNAGLEERLPRLNDCIAPIDDFETITGTNSQKYQQIRNLAYGISAGSERGRHSSFSANMQQWRVILVTSMEKPIAELAKSVREARQPGESIRLIDLPAVNKGASHVFDRAQARGQDITARWKSKAFATIVESCELSHGAVFKAFLLKITSDPEQAKKLAIKYKNSFIKKVAAEGDGDLAQDVARKFGLIFAGGRLAIRYKLLPWKRTDLLAAIQDCYHRARNQLADDGVITSDGLTRLAAALNALAKRDAVSSFDSVKGFKSGRLGSWMCLVKAEWFSSIFKTNQQKELVVEWLIARNRIIMSKPKQGRRSPKLQFIWPDGERRRSFRISLPMSGKLI